MKEFITVAEAARLLKLCDKTVRNYYKSGRLNLYKVPGKKLYLLKTSEVQELTKPRLSTAKS